MEIDKIVKTIVQGIVEIALMIGLVIVAVVTIRWRPVSSSGHMDAGYFSLKKGYLLPENGNVFITTRLDFTKTLTPTNETPENRYDKTLDLIQKRGNTTPLILEIPSGYKIPDEKRVKVNQILDAYFPTIQPAGRAALDKTNFASLLIMADYAQSTTTFDVMKINPSDLDSIKAALAKVRVLKLNSFGIRYYPFAEAHLLFPNLIQISGGIVTHRSVPEEALRESL